MHWILLRVFHGVLGSTQLERTESCNMSSLLELGLPEVPVESQPPATSSMKWPHGLRCPLGMSLHLGLPLFISMHW